MADKKQKEFLEINDGDNYRRLSEPFDDVEDANSALTKFWEDLYALRNKHGLANVTVVVKDSVKDSGAFMWSAHCGSSLEEEAMAAWHFGQASSRRQDSIRVALEEGSRAIAVAKRRK